MKESFEANLWINGASVELNPFVEEFLARTVAGAVRTLKGAEGMQTLDLHLEQGDVRIVVNGNEVPLTPFPNDIIVNTVTAMASCLKGVDSVDNLRIEIRVV